jgi:hypothetical protein
VVFPHQNQIKSKFGDYKTQKQEKKIFSHFGGKKKRSLLPTGQI